MAEGMSSLERNVKRARTYIEKLQYDKTERIKVLSVAGAALIVLVLMIIFMPWSRVDIAIKKYNTGRQQATAAYTPMQLTDISDKGVLTLVDEDKEEYQCHLADISYTTYEASDGTGLRDAIARRCSPGSTVWVEKAGNNAVYLWTRSPADGGVPEHELLQTLIIADGWATPTGKSPYADTLNDAFDKTIEASSGTNTTWDAL